MSIFFSFFDNAPLRCLFDNPCSNRKFFLHVFFFVSAEFVSHSVLYNSLVFQSDGGVSEGGAGGERCSSAGRYLVLDRSGKVEAVLPSQVCMIR